MLEFVKAGGVPGLFVLLMGLLTLGTAVWFMAKPADRHIGMIRSLSVATVFVVLAAIAADLAAVFTHVPNNPEWAQSPDLALIVMTGIGEALAPAVSGFSLLALSWLATASGVRRLGPLH